MIETSNKMTTKQFDSPLILSSGPRSFVIQNNDIPPEAFRIIDIKKANGEPLGITVKNENDRLVIARVLAGGSMDRQGLLNTGDIILEVNGIAIRSPADLQQQLHNSLGHITIKILPSNICSTVSVSPSHNPNIYAKTLYAYDPSKDSLLPCKEIGLSFKQGDILQILNQKDPNWWQARRLDSLEHAGLIPSQELEERRRAFVPPEYDHATRSTMCGTILTKKKQKTMYQCRANVEFDKAELLLYEEVACVPPFQRRTLVLLGSDSTGRSTLKYKLIKEAPHEFGTPVPHTSRPMQENEQEGKTYYFVTREEMESDIAENRYLEYGEYNDHLYGTKLDSIQEVIDTGKMCILDCNPQALKIIKTSEFKPFVVFIAVPPIEELKNMEEYRKFRSYNSCRNLTFDRAMGRYGSRRAKTMTSLASVYEEEDVKNIIEESARLQRAYDKYFDLVLLNKTLDQTYIQLKEAIEALSKEPQWVPISWVY